MQTTGMYWIIVIISSHCWISVLSSSCPSKCYCGNAAVDCSFKGLNAVPTGLDPNVQILDLQGNNISVIRRTDFSNLRKLETLSLPDNRIEVIEPGSFDNLGSLDRLKLNRNRLKELPEFLFSKTTQLARLELSNNHLNILRPSSLSGLNRLTNLQLGNNALSCIESNTFEGLNRLEILALDGNNLTSLTEDLFDGMSSLQILRLKDNSFHCDCNLAWLSTWLKVNTQLARYAKCASPHALAGESLPRIALGRLYCSDGARRVSRIECRQPVPAQCPSRCSCNNGIVNCEGVGLETVPEGIPEDATELRLVQNHLTRIPAGAFSKFKNLQKLDLSNNRISTIEEGAFTGLSSLTSLVLFKNEIESLPADIFQGLYSLDLLLLNANKISCIRSDIFKDLHELTLLSLYDNKLTNIANGTFDPLRKVQYLQLAQNPFECNCNLLWLAEYLHQNPVENSHAKCDGPKPVASWKLTKLRQKGSLCHRVVTSPLHGTCQAEGSCPEGCSCSGGIVNCSSKSFTTIPADMPSFTTDLTLANNKIQVIPRRAFAHLPLLQKLDLSDNQISKIQEDAFLGSDNLIELRLTGNMLKKLKGDMFTGLTTLRTLMLRSNRITCINNSTFSEMANLRLLSLYDNEITCLQNGSFDKLTSLSTLNLLDNRLNCDCQLRWLSTWLRSQSLNLITGNPMCVTPSRTKGNVVDRLDPMDFRCRDDDTAGGCKQGSCCSDEVETCHPPSVCPRGCTCIGTAVRCSDLGLTQFPENIPMETTELYLDVNAIREIPPEINRLTHLTSIDLSNNKLESIPSYQFINLTRLTTLILSYNKIKCIQPNSFANMKGLKLLNFYRNNISTIPYNSFRDLTDLTNIVLGENPLWCDCNLKWLADWIKVGRRENGVAKCEGPTTMENRLLLSTPATYFQCAENHDASHILAKCDACSITPCENGGRCLSQSYDSFECICTRGYYGDRCQSQINACFGNPCRNNGKCSADGGRFTCHCPPGFTGHRCEVNVDDCSPNLCQNGATCEDLIEDYQCQCAPGFTGVNCETSLDYCEELKPCKNGGQCTSLANDYRCECASGFTDKNCSTNKDDCTGNICQNAAHCIDELGGYSCGCLTGYSGEYCEIKTHKQPKYLRSSVCQSSDCKNGGICFQPQDSSEYECQCASGFGGKKCEKLLSLSFHHNSYVQASELTFTDTTNITIILKTKETLGVLMYQGDNEAHLAAELYMGRIRVSFNLGNYPIATNMFSYGTVNDGKQHVLELLVERNNLTMSLDGSKQIPITDNGDKKFLDVSSPLFFGGLAPEIQVNTVKNWHLLNSTSFMGCFKAVHINEKRYDFNEPNVVSNKILPGCGGKEDKSQGPCANNRCKRGACLPNYSTMGYSCVCNSGWTGTACDQPEITCAARTYKAYYTDEDTGCKSRGKVKLRRCVGDDRCSARSMRTKRIKIQCEDKSSYYKEIAIVRKCSRSRKRSRRV